MTTERANHTATLLPNGMVLIAGGNGTSGWLSSAEIYDPATKVFSTTGSMATARTFATAVLLANGTVLIAGGGEGAVYVKTAEIYSPGTGTFSATGSLITARTYHTATLLADGSVLIAGGTGNQGGLMTSLNSAEIYVPLSGQFTPVGTMVEGRCLHTATLLTDGTVLLAGGTNSYGTPLTEAEIYTPQSLSFAATGSLHTARYEDTATPLSDGTVLIAGGFASSSLSSAEIYTVSSKSFAATGNMTTARASQTATLLNDGTVLVTGGTNTTTAELYSYPFKSGALTPKYVVLGVLYSPPGAKSSVSYNTSTSIGTSSQFTDTYGTSTKISASLGISGSNANKSISGSVTGTASYTWSQQADSISTYTVNKTQTTGVAVAGPLSSAIGIDHDYDTVIVWLNPKVNLSVGTVTTDLLWNGYSYDSNDIYSPNGPDIVYLSIFCLKNPFLNPDCTGSNYLTSRSWDTTSGLGGLTPADYLAIAARDPFFVNSSYDPNNDPLNRFTPTQQSVGYKPAPPGDGPITNPGTLTVQTTSSLGQDASDSYQVSYSLDASIKAAISADFSDTQTTMWSNKWSETQTDTVGQTSTYSITTPVATDNYSGPQSFEVFQDNVYGTFMFVAPGTTPTSPGSIGVSPSSITFTPAVAVGSTSTPTVVTLKNNAVMPMYMGVSSAFPFTSASTALSPVAAFSDPAFFVVAGSDSCTGKIIAPAASCTLSISFSPVVSDIPSSGGSIMGGVYFTAETDAAVLASANLTGTEEAATPTSSLASGTYTGAQTVTLSDATAGATIYYTTNGAMPTTSSAVYTGPITVSASETLKAIAVVSGYSNSVVWAATYTITTPIAATPTISTTPTCLVNSTADFVYMGDTTTGATIYYTTDGTTPTTSSSVYSSRLYLTTTTTYKEIAVASGYITSAVATTTIVPSCVGVA